jgi:beta-glucanase (GH16 family)
MKSRDPRVRPGLFVMTLALSALSVRCGGDANQSADPDASANAGGSVSAAGSSPSAAGANPTGGAGSGAAGSRASAGGGGSAGKPNVSSNAGADSSTGVQGTAGSSSNAGSASNVAGAAAGSGGSSAGGSAGSAGAPSLPGWTIAFSDEFNGPKGTAVDTSKWALINKGDGFGNNELQFYSNRTDNAALDGEGSLVITAKKEAYMGREYTSARLESKGKFERTYGRIEARLKLPRGQGIWPAFWMLGNDISSMPWPNCGEIDVMENIGKEPTIVHGTLHGPGYSGGNPLGAAYTLPNGEKFADAFHVFAVEWEKDVIRFYVDDNLYKTRTPADVPANGRWVYDHPFFLLLNVAVGGQWPGSPDGTTVFPQTMLVDYVRVYGK